jgi:hypothetical protein
VGEKRREPDFGEYVDFLEALRRAEAEAVVSNVEVITKAAQSGDWLEKRAVEDTIPDTNRDVIQERVAEYWAALERRSIRRLHSPRQ